jgi:hypothetical protein
VVGFVLHDAGRPPRKDSVNGLAVFVERFNPHAAVTGHHPGEPGNAEAPFVKANLLALTDRLEGGVGQDGEGEVVPFPGHPLVLG